MGSWPIILIILFVGYVIGRCRPFHQIRSDNQLLARMDKAARADRRGRSLHLPK
jgi:hypothetical protein